jgi:hypothetical protein
MFLLLLLAACGESSASTTSTSVTTADISTTTSEMETTAVAAQPLPTSGCCDGVELAPGRYELPGYWGDPLVVEVGDGWRVNFENAAVLLAFVQGANAVDDPSRWFYLIRAPAELGPEQVIEDMAAMTSITVDQAPVAIEIAGFPGFQFDASAKDNPDQPAVPANGIEAGSIRLEALNDTGYFTTGFLIISATRQSMLRFIALDVGQRTLLALIDAPPAEFGDFAAESEQILGSLSH